jgi:NADPH2:quinone reductase
MKAVRFHQIGGPEVLHFEEVHKPQPGPGQALLRVHVVGVNFADTLLRRGTYIRQPSIPEIPGYEAAGIVEEVGKGAETTLVGQRFVALT